MPYTFKKTPMAYKDPTSEDYLPIELLSDGELPQKVAAVENSIAPNYDDLTFPISEGEACMHDGSRYVANQNISTTENWTAAHWTLSPVSAEISSLSNALSKSSENTNIAISAHQKHSLFWFNGSLHIALDDIAIGDTITTDGQMPNASEVTIDEALIKDVQVNGSSILNNGVANVPLAGSYSYGAVAFAWDCGIWHSTNGALMMIVGASDANMKNGENIYFPIVSAGQHKSVFFGLAKAAGADMKNIASTTIGQYPETQKSAISQMLNGAVQVTGTTPVINAKPGIPYVCGEVSTLDIVAPASGDIEVIFDSGSTATVLTVTPPTGVTAIKWANGFDPTALEANTRYDLIITDGEWGLAASWGA